MFDYKATQAWWNFFHRYSLIYRGDQFDKIVNLGLNLLQCDVCQKEAIPFWATLRAEAWPFEKVHLLHNYVNRRLGKRVFTLDDGKRVSADIINGGFPRIIQVERQRRGEFGREDVDWDKLLKIYFELLFSMSKYLSGPQLDDLKVFSKLIYDSLDLPKQIKKNFIDVNGRSRMSREQIQVQTFDYYNKTISAIKDDKVAKGFRNYKQVYGKQPRKVKTCSSCAKRHKLLMERHQLREQGQQPKAKHRYEGGGGGERKIIKKAVPIKKAVNRDIKPISEIRKPVLESRPKPRLPKLVPVNPLQLKLKSPVVNPPKPVVKPPVAKPKPVPPQLVSAPAVSKLIVPSQKRSGGVGLREAPKPASLVKMPEKVVPHVPKPSKPKTVKMAKPVAPPRQDIPAMPVNRQKVVFPKPNRPVLRSMRANPELVKLNRAKTLKSVPKKPTTLR